MAINGRESSGQWNAKAIAHNLRGPLNGLLIDQIAVNDELWTHKPFTRIPAKALN